jgi:hypothetical protein
MKMKKASSFLLGLISLIIISCTAQNRGQEHSENKEEKIQNPKEDSLRAVLSDSSLLLLDNLFQKAKAASWDQLPNEAIISKVGQYFIELPYVAHTLEAEGEEQVVMNLCSLDCVTYLESVLALSKSIKNGTYTISDYHDQLKKLRYREGKLGDYSSRLHYYSEWLKDNERLGLLSIVSNQLKVEKFDNQVNFMSNHVASYKQLAADSTLVPKMQAIEERISQQELYYIPKDQLPNYEQSIKDGDIIMYATNIEGLDVSHVALAHWKGDQLHFMHASTADMKVVVSDQTIYEYLLEKEKNSGILVARALL